MIHASACEGSILSSDHRELCWHSFAVRPLPFQVVDKGSRSSRALFGTFLGNRCLSTDGFPGRVFKTVLPALRQLRIDRQSSFVLCVLLGETFHFFSHLFEAR